MALTTCIRLVLARKKVSKLGVSLYQMIKDNPELFKESVKDEA